MCYNLKRGVSMNKIVKGIVTGIEPYGIFVKIDDETDGLIHISEISSKFVKDPSEFAKIGDEIEAEVLETTEDGNIKLSIKTLREEKKKTRKRRYIKETSIGFRTLEYKLPFWIEKNLKKHKNDINSIDK
jgi:general stress protein 13